MAIVRTAKGTVSNKSPASTLTLSSVSINAGATIIVGLSFVSTLGDPDTVKWGFRELKKVISRSQSGMTTALYILRYINNNATRDIVATWSGSIAAKAMFVTMIEGAQVEDETQGNTNTATANPGTGTAVTTNVADTMHIAAFGSRGPDSDTVGTVGVGHTSGQRIGTTGAPPASNVTIHETYELLTATGNVRSAKTGATSRDWANVIVALKLSTINKQGITPSDLALVDLKAGAGSYNSSSIIFYYEGSLDRWEARIDSRTGTLVAHSANNWA